MPVSKHENKNKTPFSIYNWTNKRIPFNLLNLLTFILKVIYFWSHIVSKSEGGRQGKLYGEGVNSGHQL